MKQIKFDIKLLALIFVTVFLAGAIIVVFRTLTQEEKGKDFVPVATTQTKAAPVTYSKDIVLAPTTAAIPTAEAPVPSPSPTISLAPSPSVSPTAALIAKADPTPTEVIIAKVSATPSPTKEASQSASPTVVPTKTASLPSAGSVQFPVLIFASAFLLIMFAFLF